MLFNLEIMTMSAYQEHAENIQYRDPNAVIPLAVPKTLSSVLISVVLFLLFLGGIASVVWAVGVLLKSPDR